MLSNEPFASLTTFFRTSLIKFYHNSQRMTDSSYHMTVCKKIRVQNILIAKCKSTMFWNFCVGIQMYSASNDDVMKYYLTRVRNKKIQNDYITLEKKGCYVMKGENTNILHFPHNVFYSFTYKSHKLSHA